MFFLQNFRNHSPKEYKKSYEIAKHHAVFLEERFGDCSFHNLDTTIFGKRCGPVSTLTGVLAEDALTKPVHRLCIARDTSTGRVASTRDSIVTTEVWLEPSAVDSHCGGTVRKAGTRRTPASWQAVLASVMAEDFDFAKRLCTFQYLEALCSASLEDNQLEDTRLIPMSILHGARSDTKGFARQRAESSSARTRGESVSSAAMFADVTSAALSSPISSVSTLLPGALETVVDVGCDLFSLLCAATSTTVLFHGFCHTHAKPTTTSPTRHPSNDACEDAEWNPAVNDSTADDIDSTHAHKHCSRASSPESTKKMVHPERSDGHCNLPEQIPSLDDEAGPLCM